MSFKTQVFAAGDYPREAARLIAESSAKASSLVLTGGTTAEKVYRELAAQGVDWAGLSVLFSDERCVPPDDPESNFGMARRLLFADAGPKLVHRMRGEDPPESAAEQYHEAISSAVSDGLDLLLLGMGADAHVCAMFPGSPVVEETTRFCRAVDRPDGMKGLTLTPPVVLSARKILLIVTGDGKAETVRRVVEGGESPESAPARMLARHEDVTFVLDEGAASAL